MINDPVNDRASHLPISSNCPSSDSYNVSLPPDPQSVTDSHSEWSLPVVLNINPRSCYGKSKELGLLISEYSSSLICISESWSRENEPIEELIDIENFKIIKNVKQREGRGGKPIILADETLFNIIEVCPGLITVPVEVEAVWVILQPKDRSKSQGFKFIAVCSYYYAGPKRTPRNILYDHFVETCNVLMAKYGDDLEFILSSDSNKLNLNPILDILPSFRQVVKVPTRLNPEATLDTIITTLS